MSNFKDYIDSPLLISKEVMVLRKEALMATLKGLNSAQMQGVTSDKCLYASLMTMFDAGFAVALMKNDKGETSTTTVSSASSSAAV